MDTPPTGSFRRDPNAALAANPVGIVPFGWDRIPSDLPELARLGFEGIQVDGGEAAMWVEALTDHSLRAAEVYLAIPCDADGPTAEAHDVVETRLAYAVDVGTENLVLAVDGGPIRDAVTGHATGGPSFTDDGWERLGGLVEEMHTVGTDAGLVVSFHPHAGTWVETPAEIDRLFSMSSRLDLCLDTGHHLVGGGDPATTIAEYGDRLRHVHLKDVDPRVLGRLRDGNLSGFTEATGARIFCPLGSGVLDLPGVVATLERIGYQGWLMVEQDTMWEPTVESAAISRRILEWVCSPRR